MTESYIQTGPGGTTFVGPDATELFRAATLMSALGLLKAGIVPTRGLSSKRALAMASGYTGKKYKRGQHDLARADLKVWIETMKSALPIVEQLPNPFMGETK
jgi:hypothetical protein